LAWPGDLPVVVRLGGDCSSGFPRRCRVTCCRAVRGPAGAPGAAQRRGRTSWTLASDGRWSGSEEEPAGYWL